MLRVFWLQLYILGVKRVSDYSFCTSTLHSHFSSAWVIFLPQSDSPLVSWEFLASARRLQPTARSPSLYQHFHKWYSSLSSVLNPLLIYLSLLMAPFTTESVYISLLEHNNFLSNNSPHQSLPDPLQILSLIMIKSPNPPLILAPYQYFKCTYLLLFII